MQIPRGKLMLKDEVIGEWNGQRWIPLEKEKLPVYLQRTGDLEGWLESRAIDGHRTNSRLLKKLLRIQDRSDLSTVLRARGASITDSFWFLPDGEQMNWEQVRFKHNDYDVLALTGHPDSFKLKSFTSPELTNTGSFEKCWKLENGSWYMLKSGNDLEFFSELFVYELGKYLGFSMAKYEMDPSGYIRTQNFTTDEVFLDPMSGFTEDDDYSLCFSIICSLSPDLACQYLELLYLDSLVCNMDRHTGNFGFLRSAKTGEILKMAPNYDNNIALISRGYPTSSSRNKDQLIQFLIDFLNETPEAKSMFRQIRSGLPELNREVLRSILNRIPIQADKDFVLTYILNGYEILQAI